MEISDDKKSAKISINTTLTAAGIESLISELAVIRANMLPQVPLEPPKPSDPVDVDAMVSEQDKPYFQVRLLRDLRIRMYLRNQGLGWLIFNIPQDHACSLRDYLIANTPAGNSAHSLLSKDDGSSGTPH